MTDNRRRKLALFATATLTVMSTAIVAPALPRLAASFADVPNAALLTRLVLTLPAVFIVMAAPLAGAIVDRFGRRRFLVGALALYGAAGGAGAVLGDLHWILASRALLGIAIAGTMTTVTALAGDYFNDAERTRFTSRQSMIMSIGSAASILVGGVLTDLDWRLSFLVYLAGWVVMLPVLAWIDEPKRHAVVQARDAGPRSPISIWLWVVYAVAFFGILMFYLIPVQIPFLLRQMEISSATLAAVALGVAAITSAVSPLAYARLRRRLGFGGMYAVAFALMGAGYLVVFLATTYLAILLGLAVTGIGVGFFFPNNHLWMLALAPAHARGRLSGGLTSSIFLGQFFCPLLSYPLVAGFGLAGTFGVAAALLGAGAILLSRVKSTH